MIEYDDRDRIPAFLLPSSHSGRKSFAERRVVGILRYRTIGSGRLPAAQAQPDRVWSHALSTAADGGGLLEAT
jgi:hypothetical protein